jgi:SAM-dependent methyltransferase
MEYSQAYENSLHFSPQFQAFAEQLADRLIALHNLRGKHIIDIGCGKGDFLRLLSTRGDNVGVGFDRSYVPTQEDARAGAKVSFVQEFYSELHAGYGADLISCRHVLEHIEDPRHFLAGIRKAIGARPSTAVYFEVPNALYTLRDLGIWDLIYEHCSYYSPDSLRRLFSAGGFRVDTVAETFGGQYLGIDAFPADGPCPTTGTPADDLPRLVDAFGRRYREKVDQCRAILRQAAGAGKRIVAWGGGSKGVTFLNVLRNAAPIEALVDLNPRKHGLFVGGTGQRITAPEDLPGLRPDVIIIMNPLYQGEIAQQVASLGLKAELLPA